MTTYRIVFQPAARRQLKRLDVGARKQVVETIARLADDPRPPGIKALSGQHALLRIRTGDYRIVYTVNDDQLLVLVVALGHRREIYRSI